jgi:uncharacterized protein
MMRETKIAAPDAAHAGALSRLTKEIKRAAAMLSDVTPEGTFEGYASLFDVADMGRDVVLPGAFRDSLLQRGARGIKMLWQHEAGQPIGSWEAIAEDARGLRVKGRLNLDVARAREVLSLMREGAVDGLSIGFRTERATTDKKTGLRSLSKIDLWEISVVTFPMLPQARVSAVKRSAFKSDGFHLSGDLPGDIRRAAQTLSSNRG